MLRMVKQIEKQLNVDERGQRTCDFEEQVQIVPNMRRRLVAIERVVDPENDVPPSLLREAKRGLVLDSALLGLTVPIIRVGRFTGVVFHSNNLGQRVRLSSIMQWN